MTANLYHRLAVFLLRLSGIRLLLPVHNGLNRVITDTANANDHDQKEVWQMLEKGMRDLMESVVPISRFNKGEAGKIFEEVAKSGTKIVVKNRCRMWDSSG